MRVALIGAGVIARLFLEQARRGGLHDANVVAVMGRSEESRGKALAQEFGIAFVAARAELVALRPDVVIEAASHAAVREHGEELLASGIAVIVLSAGALVDDNLRERLERASARHRTPLYVPSGGIGGLDALKAACAAGVDEVTIAVTKPPAGW
jgi:aspartate dehydrogenase